MGLGFALTLESAQRSRLHLQNVGNQLSTFSFRFHLCVFTELTATHRSCVATATSVVNDPVSNLYS
jgi:hypothetical protein